MQSAKYKVEASSCLVPSPPFLNRCFALYVFMYVCFVCFQIRGEEAIPIPFTNSSFFLPSKWKYTSSQMLDTLYYKDTHLGEATLLWFLFLWLVLNKRSGGYLIFSYFKTVLKFSSLWSPIIPCDLLDYQ